METGKPSRTAQHNALFRALEARRSPAKRVADDHLAVHFLAPEFRLLAELARIRPIHRVIEKVIDRRWPGPRGGVVVRTRFLDEEIEAAIAGVEQVLILGAGFDTRAFRLAGTNRVAIFEVDHPNTQKVKRETLLRIFGKIPDNVTLVPIEFGSEELTGVLANAGFEFGRRTLVLWEGVTNYLTAESVDSTFRFVAGATSSGSPVFFTYIDKAILDGSGLFEGAAQSSRAVRKVGEPYTFGFGPAEVGAYLTSRGFDLEWDVAVSDVAPRFYSGPRRPKVIAYYHVAKAQRR
jgi:methyltransferase (TIGR00027 family)